jgi:hypothetical protein
LRAALLPICCAYAGVRDQWCARLDAEALHDVEHPVREPGLGRDVGEQRRGERRPLRRLHDDRVARGERGGDAPGGEHERRVPRGDDGGDAGRVPRHVVAVPTRLEVVVVQGEQVVGEEAEVHRDARHHAAAVRPQQRAVVARLDLREVLDAGLHTVGDPVQDGCALRRRGPRPADEGRPGRVDRGVDLRLPTARDVRDHLAVERRDVLEGLRARDPPATDPVTGVDLDARDVC